MMGDDPGRSSCGAEPVATPDWAVLSTKLRRKVAAILIRLGIPNEDVEDLVQEILVKLYLRYDPSKVQHENSVTAFAGPIAGYAIKDYLKARRSSGRAKEVGLSEAGEENDGGAEARNLFRGLNAKRFIEGLTRENGSRRRLLERDDLELLMMVDGAGTPYETIQEIYSGRGVRVSITGLRQRVYRIREKIRQSCQNIQKYL
jgi:DNA-directed RNA polymerase specialized sigma24 family protein